MLSNGAWASTLPLANLQSRVISKVARTVDATLASTKFDLVLAKQRRIRAFGIVNHNLSSNATYRISSYTDATFSTVIYDSGFMPAWPEVYPFDTLEWEDDNYWTGQTLEEDRVGYNLALPTVLATATFAQYFRFEFSDPLNPAGYLQFGRLFLSGEWQPVVSMSKGASIGYETKTVVDEAISGAEYFDHRTPYRVAKFTLSWMSEDEAMTRAFDMQRVVGIDGEVFYMWDINDTVHRLRRTFIGRLRTMSPIEAPDSVDINQTAFEVKENL